MSKRPHEASWLLPPIIPDARADVLDPMTAKIMEECQNWEEMVYAIATLMIGMKVDGSPVRGYLPALTDVAALLCEATEIPNSIGDILMKEKSK